MTENNSSDVKPSELPILKITGSQSSREKTFARRLEIAEQYVKKMGLSNARIFTKQISEKYVIGIRQVQKDFKWIKGNFKPEDIQQIKLDIKILRDKTLNLALINIESASSPIERNDAIRTAWTVIEKYREDMESWGEKTKVPDQVNINSKSISLEIIRHDGRTKTEGEDGIEPEAGRSTEPIERQDTH